MIVFVGLSTLVSYFFFRHPYEGNTMKEEIKKFYEEHKDEIIVFTASFALTTLLAAKGYKRAYKAAYITNVNLWTNTDMTTALVVLTHNNSRQSLYDFDLTRVTGGVSV